MKVKYQNINKNIVAVFIVFIGVCGLMLAHWSAIGDRELDRKNRNIDFAGKVKRIEYDIKQFPTITVNDSTYYIGYNTDHQIEIGDSVIKKKGADFYILIKYKTHKIIKLTN